VHVRLLPGSEAVAGQQLLLEFEYVWINVNAAAPEDTTIIPVNYPVKTEDLQGGNSLISFGFIEKSNATISSMLSCRFSRISIEEGWEDYWRTEGLENDSFRGMMVLLEFDFHIQKDSEGSKELYTK
jgi:hypothetical protein